MNVNSANLCLSCDTLFEGEECAKCGDKKYKPLKDWIKPLFNLDDIREAYNYEKYKEESPQKNKNNIRHTTCSLSLYHDRLTKPRTRVGCKEAISKDDTATVDEDHKKASPVLEASSRYHQGGKRGRSERCIEMWGSGADAGHTTLGKVLCWCEQIGTLFSRKEHRSGVQDSPIPSEK